jgi:hypothetical protein
MQGAQVEKGATYRAGWTLVVVWQLLHLISVWWVIMHVFLASQAQELLTRLYAGKMTAACHGACHLQPLVMPHTYTPMFETKHG